ncbi:MAG: tRNA (adenosine(37)-N6)-dimethylallyltransferase MiaA [Thermomicrobiales bacterium]
MSDDVAHDAPMLVVVAGPTAVGKTELGIELALRFDGEVVNADSRYLFRGMDVGVAKPEMAERRGVPHHLIDVVDPDAEMSLATYQAMAYQAIAGVIARGRLPLLVGGTPLYLNAVVEGWRIPRVSPDPAFRAKMEAILAHDGVAALSAKLAAVDPVAAARSGTNPRRIIRALEIHRATGRPMSEVEGKGPRPYRTLELGLTMPRDQLYAAVDRRVDDQITRGLVEEVRLLLEGGLSPNASSMTSLGYRQLVPYLAGEISLDEAIQRIKHDTHRYVRHQQTWLRRNPRLVAVDVTQPGWIERAADLVSNFTRTRDAIPMEHPSSI